MKPTKYIISFAQNSTLVHGKFLASMKTFAEAEKAEIIVALGYYRNPTAKGEKTEPVWDTEILPFATRERRQLCPNLCLYADIPVQPTASNPLSGFNVLVGKNSGILAHPKRAFECIPTDTRMPRVLATTSSCTVANYSRSKAGAKGDAHHVIGALVAEVDASGAYFLSHVTAEKDGSFYYFEKRYGPEGVTEAPPALSLTLGDLHVGQDDPKVLAATQRLVKLVRPVNIVLHDVLDFRTRNHHDRGMRSKFAKRDQRVQDEVEAAAKALGTIAGWGEHKVHVVRSNHDEAMERWLEDTKPYEDPENAPYYHMVWSRVFEYYAEHGQWPDVFAMECERLEVPESVRFLRRDESLKFKDVEHGFHGDKGVSGSRGSTRGYSKLGVKVTKAHDHTAAIMDGCYGVGVTGSLDMGYNLKPSTWVNAHVLQYASGKRAVVFIINGQFRAQRKKK